MVKNKFLEGLVEDQKINVSLTLTLDEEEGGPQTYGLGIWDEGEKGFADVLWLTPQQMLDIMSEADPNLKEKIAKEEIVALTEDVKEAQASLEAAKKALKGV